jgi:hypothetical protein
MTDNLPDLSSDELNSLLEVSMRGAQQNIHLNCTGNAPSAFTQ